MVNRLRLGSGLILFTFVLCHLLNSAFGLVSPGMMNRAQAVLLAPWQWPAIEIVLLGAALVHLGVALRSLWVRRNLRLQTWEWLQIVLGFSIPFLLFSHLVGARIVALTAHQANIDYYTVLASLWIARPEYAVVQAALVLGVWGHACVGLRAWLNLKPWYGRAAPYLLSAAVLVPTLALAGFVAAGNAVRHEIRTPEDLQFLLADSNLSPDTVRFAFGTAETARWVALAVLIALFTGRWARHALAHLRPTPRLALPDGRSFRVTPGASVLETLRENGVPHASVCGGRGRCTTCRVRIADDQIAHVAPPNPIETAALRRMDFPAGVRLACQISPSADLAVTPLLPATAKAADGQGAGGLDGREQEIAAMFIDLRGSTALAEARLPFDVLFVLNEFFSGMNDALEATGGHYAQFTGDGLLALFGLSGDPAQGCRDAVRCAAEMLKRLDSINERLRADLHQPLAMGIGIHFGVAIVGEMGPPTGRRLSAIGDTINTTARLESLTKEIGVPVIVSAAAAEQAGIDVSAATRHEAPIRGRAQPMTFFGFERIATDAIY